MGVFHSFCATDLNFCPLDIIYVRITTHVLTLFPFESGLRKFALDPVFVILFAKNIYVVKYTSSDLIISELVVFTT